MASASAPRRRAARSLGRVAILWAPALGAVWALGWAVTAAIGVDVETQYTVFGSSGAVVVTAPRRCCRCSSPSARLERDVSPAGWLALGVLCASLLAIVVDNTIVNVALPTLARDLDADVSELQWVVDAYTLVFAGLLLLAGALGDRYGRRRMLLVGLAVFGVASAGAAFAGGVDGLIAARAVMGAGAAFIMPATLSLLIGVFTDPRERATAIGIWAATAGLGVALGPVVGGVLLDHFWWGSIFIVNVPLVASRSSRAPAPPRVARSAAQRIDWPGAALSGVGLVALRLGGHRGARRGAGRRARCSAPSRSPRSRWSRSSCGSAGPRSRCSTSACSATRASARRAARSWSCSSRCSGSSSSRRSTCSSSSATRRRPPACACCRTRAR